MEENEQQELANKEYGYTVDNLRTDIATDLQHLQDNCEGDLPFLRYAVQIFSELFSDEWKIADTVSIPEEAEKAKDKIGTTISNNYGSGLATYSYFVADNPQFHYNWSYLLGRIDAYKEYVFEYRRDIGLLVRILNIVAANIGQTPLVFRIDVNDTLTFSIDQTSKGIKGCIKKERFHRLASLKSPFTLKLINIITKRDDKGKDKEYDSIIATSVLRNERQAKDTGENFDHILNSIIQKHNTDNNGEEAKQA